MVETIEVNDILRNAALSELSISELMNGRDKLSTADVENRELTIAMIDFASYEKKGKQIEYPVIVFAEAPNAFYCGGLVLYKMCKAVITAATKSGLYTGEGIFEYPDSCAPLRVKIVTDRTSDGEHNITRVIIL